MMMLSDILNKSCSVGGADGGGGGGGGSGGGFIIYRKIPPRWLGTLGCQLLGQIPSLNHSKV